MDPHVVQSHGFALLPLKCYQQLNFSGCSCAHAWSRPLSSVNSSCVLKIVTAGGLVGQGPPCRQGEHAEVTQRCPKPSLYYFQLPPSGPKFTFVEMNQVCSVFLRLHGWHVISLNKRLSAGVLTMVSLRCAPALSAITLLCSTCYFRPSLLVIA